MNWQLQVALFNKLNVSAITNIVRGVYDHVPQAADAGDDSQFPYITIGEARINEFDTDEVLGFDASCVIHVWSRQRGRKQVKQIQDVIYQLLHRANLAIVGYDLITIDQEFAESFVDSDGLTRHGVQQFRVLFQNP